jgi:hypothetical protein
MNARAIPAGFRVDPSQLPWAELRSVLGTGDMKAHFSKPENRSLSTFNFHLALLAEVFPPVSASYAQSGYSSDGLNQLR